MADKKDAPKRSKAQIEQELAAARARLSGNVQELIGEVHPKAVTQRTVADAKAFASQEVDKAKAQVKDPVTGEWRQDRLVAIGGAVAGLVTFIGIVRGITKKARKH